MGAHVGGIREVTERDAQVKPAATEVGHAGVAGGINHDQAIGATAKEFDLVLTARGALDLDIEEVVAVREAGAVSPVGERDQRLLEVRGLTVRCPAGDPEQLAVDRVTE